MLNLLAVLVAIVSLFASVQAEAPLDLGLAAPYAILAGSTVTSSGVAGTVVNGNVGIFPGYALTGFPPAKLNGALDSANKASGGAQGSLTTAYNTLAGKAFDVTLSNQDLGGMTLIPGVYKFDKSASMNGVLTLDAQGDAAAVWTFQIGSALLVAQGSSIIFKDSIGNPDYVYWQVATTATLAKGVPMIGNILALASIIVNDGTTVKGRCLARNAAVTLDRSIVTVPTKASFRAQQTITGISLEQYNTNPNLNSATLKTAIAMSMPSTTSTNIKSFAVTAGTTASKTIITLATARALTTTTSIVVDYLVSISTTMTVAQLQAQLDTAVEDGSFTRHLHATATSNGATDLQQASSNNIETQSASENSATNSDNKNMSGGAIAGAVIGTIFGFLLIVLVIALLVYIFFYRGSSAEVQKPTVVTTQEV